MTKKLSKEHKFNLIENAHDSLQHAIEHMKSGHENSIRDWKFIIISLAHVVELLLKEKLRKINPTLIYENIDYKPSINSKTVGAENALTRLENFSNLRFSETDKLAIDIARKKRNQIEHFEFVITEQQAQIITGQAIAFIFRFSKEHLKLDWESKYKFDNWEVFSENEKFYENQELEANKKIESEQLGIIECPYCCNEFFSTEYEKCLLCGYKEDVLECKQCRSKYLYRRHFSYVEDEDVGLCQDCEREDGYASANFEKY